MIEIPLRCKPTAFVAAGIMASALIVLTGCKERTTTASVTGVNYTDETIAGFQVIQPDDFDNRSPTQEAMAYGAGGQMCCYALPYHWHEGLKIELKVEPDIQLPVFDGQYQREHDKRRDEGTLYQYVEVDVSHYEPGKAQLLWIQFLPNKQYRAIATDLAPNSPNFPSDVKGWPVPSVAFRHKLWEIEVDRVKKEKYFSLQYLNKKRSESDWEETWDSYKNNTKISKINEDGFKGYADIRFRAEEENSDKKIFLYYTNRLKNLLENEPK